MILSVSGDINYVDHLRTILKATFQYHCLSYFTKVLTSAHLNQLFIIPKWILAQPRDPFDLTPTYEQVTYVIRKIKASGFPCPLDQISVICFKQCPFLRTHLSTKCTILSITNKHKPSHFQYKLGVTHLQHIQSHRYLGVTCNSKLQWSEHVNNIANKANRTLEIIRRMLKPCSAEVKSRAYKTLVRPQLEYASSAWSPYYENGVNKLEQVRRNAARLVTGNYL